MEKVRIVICMMIMIVSVKAYGWKGILGSCCCCDEKEEIEEMGRPLMGGGVVGGVGGIGKIDSRQEGGYQRQSVQEVIGPARVQEPVVEEIRGNRVMINGETIKKDIYGGKVVSDRGTVIGNVVEISGSSVAWVRGGEVDGSGTVRDNVVRISSASVGCVCGGKVDGRGTARDNVVRISSASVEYVEGGRVKRGEVKNNVVEISSANMDGVRGGYANEGDASTVVSSNRVRIEGGRVEGADVYGGRCLTAGKVEGNEVEIINGDIRKQLLANGDTDGGDICGGSIDGDDGNTKIVSNNNRVKIVGGRVEGEVGGGNAGIGEGCEGIVSNNEVEIKEGYVGESVYGGKVYGYAKNRVGTVINNRVRIVGGKVERNVYGGHISGQEGMRSADSRGKVEGNEVELINVKINGNVYGGCIEDADTVVEGIVRGNTVRIVGGKVEGHVFGGYSRAYPTSGVIPGNVVELKGNPKFSMKIYGMVYLRGTGREDDSNTEIDSRGNTLIVETEEQVIVTGIKNFENYNFKKVKVNEPAKIKVFIGGRLFLEDAKVNLKFSRVVGRVEGEVKEGDRVNLIESVGIVTEAKSVELYKESGLVKLSHERVGNEKELSLKIKGQELTPQAEKITEVGATGLIVVGQGLGFLSEKGIEEAVRSVKGKEGAEVFVGVGGESSKYKSGMEMNIEGVRAVGGIAKSMKEGEIVVGGYVEHGKGNYKVEEVEGKGMTRYIGVGGMGRVMVGEEVYIDMSVGVGRQEVELDSAGLNVLLSKENIGYEDKGMYVGGHVGCGYKREVGEKVNVEVVGKVLMMRQEGKEVKLTNGVPVEFEGATSGKIKGIVKVDYKCNEKVVPYVGVGYEYEFLGKAKGKVEGVEMKEIDIKGGSGIGEIGVRSEMGDININISGRGYIGEREGIEGMLKVGYSI